MPTAPTTTGDMHPSSLRPKKRIFAPYTLTILFVLSITSLPPEPD
jgi:hypothetical protein